MNTKQIISVVLGVSILTFSAISCTSVPKQADYDAESFAREPSSTSRTPFERFSAVVGYKNYYANLHAHHYMEHKGGEELQKSGPCPHTKAFPQDDGRPCRADGSGQAQIVTPPSDDRLDYFKLYCDYAKEKGGIDILMVTPHSKSGKDTDTDTRIEGYVARHKALASINEKYKGEFLCGLGQESSSISSGNHVNIFGHMPIANAKETKPFYWKAGEFNQFYSEVKARRDRGERVILQFNHPDVLSDLYYGPLSLDEATADPKQMKSFKKKMKEALNDYGLDDYQPVMCAVPKNASRETCSQDQANRPDRVTPEMIKQTFQTILANGGDAYSLVEVTETTARDGEKKMGGATDNAGENFYSVHARNPNARSTHLSDGLLAYIFFLKMGFKISPTANQDNHFMNPGSALKSRTGVLAKSLNEDDVFDALKNRRTYATEDQNAKIVVTARAKNGNVMMGQDVEVTADTLTLYLGYNDLDEQDPVDVRIYSYHESDELAFERNRPLGAVRTIQFKPEGATLPEGEVEPIDLKDGVQNGRVKGLRIPVKKGRTVVFVELTQKDQDKIWSAPFFINAK
jgi:hypothetical protein